MVIKFTYHALRKLDERNINPIDIKQGIESALEKENDRIYPEVVHYIVEKEGKYLRIIGKFLDEETFLVISAFYDRRLKKKEWKHD